MRERERALDDACAPLVPSTPPDPSDIGAGMLMSAGKPQGARLAAASIETFTREFDNQPDGQCQIEWTSPDGMGMQCEVFRWQRIDGFSPGDIIDITTQGRGQRTLSIPVQSSKQRVEITLDPDDMVIVKVGDDGWEYGAVIRGARAFLD